VWATHGEGNGEETPEAQERRQIVDDAGVALVMAFEISQGRRPTEKRHSNPGFDILSEGIDGQRYIEVKSTSGTWGDQGVGLSETEFAKASKEGDRFWLYVVEHADQDCAQIFRLCNPAERANHFLYDGGWKTLSESGEENLHPKEEKL
jgi:hypothetical protein